MAEGEPFDPEKIGETRANLYRTGLFYSVWVQPSPADTGKAVKSLVVGVSERPSGMRCSRNILIKCLPLQAYVTS